MINTPIFRLCCSSKVYPNHTQIKNKIKIKDKGLNEVMINKFINTKDHFMPETYFHDKSLGGFTNNFK